jgi:ABC-type uncharacterized transport system substrate-binding protein
MRARTAVRLVLCALSLLTAPLAATAQQAGGTVTIGYLGNSSPSLEADLVDAFREGLRQLGYVEGQNLVIRYQWAEGQQERAAVLAQELVRLQPDVIFTAGTPGTLAAKHATQSIPIVTAIAGDPIAAGLVASLAQPGGNVTGLSTLATELEGKRLELFKQAVPQLSRVVALRNPANPFTTIAWKAIEPAAAALGVQLHRSSCGVPMTWTAPSPRSRRRVPTDLSSSPTASCSRIGRQLCNSWPSSASLACSRFENSCRKAASWLTGRTTPICIAAPRHTWPRF